MRILCIIPAMGVGGAERTMSHLLTHLTKNFAVSLLTFESSDMVSFYPLPSSITYHKGDKLGGSGLRRLGRILSRFNLIGQIVEHFTPDVIISFMDTANIATLLACCRRKVPVIVSERVDPSQHDIGWARNSAEELHLPSRAIYRCALWSGC